MGMKIKVINYIFLSKGILYNDDDVLNDVLKVWILKDWILIKIRAKM